MGFDAAIGLVIGTMRSAADQVWKINYGVERDHHTRMLGYSEDGPNYNFNLGDASKAWALESLKESLIFSVIGPVKFFGNIGGKAYTPQGSHSKRLASYIGNTTKAYWKPLNRYTGTELKAQITAMDEISGGFLNSKISSKFSKMGKRWWMDIAKDDDAGQKLMQEYLGAIRRKYVTRAPVEWFKEFTTDWTLSLPRMTLGVVAMNLPNLYTSLRDYGFSHDAMKNAFGHSIHERITNIGTAMFFTKRPHAFHTEATPTMFSKLFNTGQLDGYIKSKSSKLREMIGGLQDFIGGNIASTDVVRAITNLGTLANAENGALPGNLNQAEFQTLKESYATLFNSKEGFSLIMDLYQRDAQIDQMRYEAWDNYLLTGKLEGRLFGEESIDGDTISDGEAVAMIKERIQEARDGMITGLDKYGWSDLGEQFDSVKSKGKLVSDWGKFENISVKTNVEGVDQTFTVNIQEADTSGRIRFLGYSNEDGQFTYDSQSGPQEVKIGVGPNKPVYEINTGKLDNRGQPIFVIKGFNVQ